jgi:aryl-alcohol dehydrogenase-like predicted oxidoreductase
VNLIDTADGYSFGESEKLLGVALKSLGIPRNELVIATKARTKMGTDLNSGGLSRYHLMDAVDQSLKRLQLDHIDLYQIHGVDPVTPIEETLSALDEIQRSGKVRYIGLCNLPAWQVMKGLAISERRGYSRFESMQVYYTIAGRDLERELIPLAQDQQLGVLVWSPLAGGLLSGKFSNDTTGPEGSRRVKFDFPYVDRPRAFRCVDAMRPIADSHGVSVARVALAWLLAKSHVTSVIIGAKNTEQLRDNLSAAELSLSEDEMKSLDEVSALPREFPGWMVERQGQDRIRPIIVQ